MTAIDSVASALYSRLTSDHLRDLLTAYFGAAKAQTLAQKSREQIIKSLDGATDASKLALLAHQIEAVAPYKHCYPFYVDEPERWTFSELLKAFKTRFPRLDSAFVPATTSGYEMQVQLFLQDAQNERIFLKLVHMVDIWDTVVSNSDERTKKRVKSRHVIVAQFLPKSGAVTINFPGFTQALAAGEGSSYVAFAAQAAELIREQLGLSIETLPLKAASDAVLNDRSAHVINLGRKMNLSGINLSAYSTGEHADFSTVLAEALQLDGNIRVQAAQLKHLAESVPGDDIQLYWQKLGIVSRLSVKEAPNEVLFIWSKSQPSTASIDLVLATLLQYREIVASDQSKLAWKYLEDSAPHFIVQPHYLTQRFSINLEQSFALLFQASKNGLFQTRYRVAKELAPDFVNRWVSSIKEIPSVVTTSDGEEFSTRNPEAVEIGFERVMG